jgi:hypothetical protein
MFTVTPATDPDGQPVAVSPEHRDDMTGRRRSVGDTARTGLSLLAHVVDIVAGVIALIIIAGILLILLKANPANSIVQDLHTWAHSLVGPFDGIFTFRNAHTAIAVNWGIAAGFYLLVAALVTRLISHTYR